MHPVACGIQTPPAVGIFCWFYRRDIKFEIGWIEGCRLRLSLNWLRVRGGKGDWSGERGERGDA